MALFNLRSNEKKEKRQTFIPYHHLGLFDRTFSATQRREGVVCAMLCVGSIEALINDIVGWYSFVASNPIAFHPNDHVANNYLTDDEREFLAQLTSNDKLRMEDKIQLFGKWDKSEELYQNLILLIKIRNGLTHIKPEELSICYETGDYTGYPKFLNNLLQKKIITKPKQAISWIESLEDREFCLWCQDVSYRVIERLKEMLPETSVKKEFNESRDFFFDIDVFRERYSIRDKA